MFADVEGTGSWWQNLAKPPVMVAIRLSIVVSLAVAVLMPSYVIANEWLDLMAVDNSCFSRTRVGDVVTGSEVRILPRMVVVVVG